MTSDGCGKAFRRCQDDGGARAYFAECEKETVEDYEEREDFLNGFVGTTENEAKSGLQGESEAHGLTAANFVGEVASQERARDVLRSRQ